MNDDDDDSVHDGARLRDEEVEEVENRSAPRPLVVYEVIRHEGEQELRRSASALAFSGLAAGLSMGFSFVTQGMLRAGLPDAPWQPLVSSFGYCIGFLIVILGRQQLFTENTLTPILPLLHHATVRRAWRVARLWMIVLATNLVGALVFAMVVAHTDAIREPVRAALLAIGDDAAAGTFWTLVIRGVFAGWLIALMVWLLPGAEGARAGTVVIVTYVIGLGGFAHVIAGAVEVFYLAVSGVLSWTHVIGGWLVPVLLGNLAGGLLLVTALNHAQVTSGEHT
ncbi:MAG TPA: formate/nitrite transporter family protein [Kofleriaceae bacterium]|jgi:formate/nitrite transporter FocA (FNT family)